MASAERECDEGGEAPCFAHLLEDADETDDPTPPSASQDETWPP